MSLSIEFLVAMAVKSTALVAGAALAVTLCRSCSAAARHLIWLAALGGLLMLPLLDGLAPRWTPEVPQALAGVPARATTVLDVVAGRSGGAIPLPSLVVWIWAAGLAAVLAQTALGLVSVARLVRRSRALEELGAEVRCASGLSVPVVCGVWTPRIVLPEAALAWPADRVRMVLKHERMHAARHDTRTYLMARLAMAIYWPNPLVWWAVSRLRREAEQACDDGVLLQGERPATYAGELMEIVRGLRSASAPPKGVLAMGRESELEGRLTSLLKSGLSRRRATPVLAACVGLLSLLILFPLAALRAPAQQTGGGIAGTVKDASGAYVTKARVTVAFANSQRKEFAVTGDLGQFAFRPLPEGTYSVEVAKPGFAKLGLQGIVVKPGQVTDVQATLNVGQVSETLSVKAERPTPVQTPQGAPTRLDTGGSVQATKLVNVVRPVYPPDAKAEGVEGTVLLRAVIGVNGGILNLERVNELVDKRLADAAIEAVKQWRYQPTLLNGVPVEVHTDITLNFTLSN